MACEVDVEGSESWSELRERDPDGIHASRIRDYRGRDR
jgi:hypothetical protein